MPFKKKVKEEEAVAVAPEELNINSKVSNADDLNGLNDKVSIQEAREIRDKLMEVPWEKSQTLDVGAMK
jgi:hypothetical protein